jgi:hypothetical protein
VGESQIVKKDKGMLKPDFCARDSVRPKRIIGKKVRIWHEGGVYGRFNDVNNIKWPSDQLRGKGGISGWEGFTPKTGDTGIIVHIFRNAGTSSRYVYLLKIKGHYVPVGCESITDVGKLDSYQQSELNRIKDSIAQEKYAAGCQFKMRNVNNSWSRAGLTNLDKLSEVYACELTTKGIDTVMLCKYISDNGSSPYEEAFILWLDNGKGYVKSFFNNSKYKPTENKAVSFDANELIKYFFVNRIDTVTSTLSYGISHDMGYSIQLFIPGYFFRERLTDYNIYQHRTHSKAIWWNMISDRLGALKKE